MDEANAYADEVAIINVGTIITSDRVASRSMQLATLMTDG